MKKHNQSKNRTQERRKPTHQRLQRNRIVKQHEENMKHYDAVVETWNGLAEMHNANNAALAAVKPIAEIIGNVAIIAKLPENVKVELSLAAKNLTNDVVALKNDQKQLTEVLKSMKPSETVNPEDPEREMENLQLLAQGSDYQDWAMRYQMTVLPGVATCLDLVNSAMPDDEKVPNPIINNTVKAQ